ncbi:MAG: hypothetical protein K6D98_04025, partial [Clostridiales bacterium]|nr:hypothetical protein [Clostridiales bacterium]
NNAVNGGPITGNTVIIINGILDGTYTVTETVPTDSGYILTAQVNGLNNVIHNNSFSFTVDNDEYVALTNTCKAVAPTDYEANVAPFVLMFAGSMLVMFGGKRRKKKKEE